MSSVTQINREAELRQMTNPQWLEYLNNGGEPWENKVAVIQFMTGRKAEGTVDIVVKPSIASTARELEHQCGCRFYLELHEHEERVLVFCADSYGVLAWRAGELYLLPVFAVALIKEAARNEEEQIDRQITVLKEITKRNDNDK